MAGGQNYVTVGLNKYTAELHNRIVQMECDFRRMKSQVESLRRETRSTQRTLVWAALRGHQEVSGAVNRWQYSWEEVQWNRGSIIFVTKSNGLHSGDGSGLDGSGDQYSNPAYNGIENMNDGSGIESAGVDINGADYPGWDGSDGFCLQPIRGQNVGPAPNCSGITDEQEWAPEHAPVVLLHLHYPDDGNWVPVFYAMNQHDGTCVPPP